MTPAKKLWQEEEHTIEPQPQIKKDPENSRIHSLVKLLIIIVLYYVILFM